MTLQLKPQPVPVKGYCCRPEGKHTRGFRWRKLHTLSNVNDRPMCGGGLRTEATAHSAGWEIFPQFPAEAVANGSLRPCPQCADARKQFSLTAEERQNLREARVDYNREQRSLDKITHNSERHSGLAPVKGWDSKPMTEDQDRYLRHVAGMNWRELVGMTRGKAAELIQAHKEAREGAESNG